MYQVSRAIFLALESRITVPTPGAAAERKAAVMTACEDVVKRMVTDAKEFKDPTRKLFHDIRPYFDLPAQPHVHAVITRYLDFAQEFIAEHPNEAYVEVMSTPQMCRADTRKGVPCQRTTQSDNGYCPSHQHLVETELREPSLVE